MDNTFLDKIDSLKSRISIGNNGAKKYLIKSEGDVEKAEELFVVDCLTIVKESLNIEMSDEKIEACLQNCNYDIQQTKDKLLETKYSLSENILIKNKDRQKALGELQSAVEEKYALHRSYWLKVDEIKKLDAILYTFMMIQEWCDYENWEGFDTAICTEWAEPAIEEIKTKLGLTALAENMGQAAKLATQFYSTEKNRHEKIDIDTFVAFYDTNRPILIEKLYNYVQKNINKFP